MSINNIYVFTFKIQPQTEHFFTYAFLFLPNLASKDFISKFCKNAEDKIVIFRPTRYLTRYLFLVDHRMGLKLENPRLVLKLKQLDKMEKCIF